MNQSTKNDLKQLEKMLINYDILSAKLKDPELSHPDCQILHASLDILKEFITDKSADIRRRLRESQKY